MFLLLLATNELSAPEQVTAPVVLVDTGEIQPDLVRMLFDKRVWNPKGDPSSQWIVEKFEDISFARRATTLNLDLFKKRKQAARFLIFKVSTGGTSFKLSELPLDLQEQLSSLVPGVTDTGKSDPFFFLEPKVEFDLSDGQETRTLKWTPNKPMGRSQFSNPPRQTGSKSGKPARQLTPALRMEPVFPPHSALLTTERLEVISRVQKHLLERYKLESEDLRRIGTEFGAALSPSCSDVLEVGEPGMRLTLESKGAESALSAMTSFVSDFARNGFSSEAEADEFIGKAMVQKRRDKFVVTVYTQAGDSSCNAASFDLFTAYLPTRSMLKWAEFE